MTSWNPWEVVTEMPHVTVARVPLPAGERGRYYRDQEVIFLSDRLLQAERRVTLTHELVHRQRGDAECATPVLQQRQELSCHQETARLLIGIHALGEAMAWGIGPVEWADDLWVDVDTVQTRLRHLHPVERGYLKRRLAMKEHTA